MQLFGLNWEFITLWVTEGKLYDICYMEWHIYIQDSGYGASIQDSGYGASIQDSGYGAPIQDSGYGASIQDSGYGAEGTNERRDESAVWVLKELQSSSDSRDNNKWDSVPPMTSLGVDPAVKMLSSPDALLFFSACNSSLSTPST